MVWILLNTYQNCNIFPIVFSCTGLWLSDFHIISYSSFSVKFHKSRRRNYEMGGFLHHIINYLNTDNHLTSSIPLRMFGVGVNRIWVRLLITTYCYSKQSWLIVTHSIVNHLHKHNRVSMAQVCHALNIWEQNEFSRRT